MSALTTVRFAHWKLYCAVVEMARSELSRRDRLVQAVTDHVHHAFPLLDDPVGLPPDIATKAAALFVRLTENGSYRAAVNAMSDDEVEYVIEHMVDLFAMLTRALESDEQESAPV